MAENNLICAVENCNSVGAYGRLGPCQSHYFAQRKSVNVPDCCVKDCDNKARDAGSDLCEKHYARLRRTGRLTLRTDRPDSVRYDGYVLAWAPGHPEAVRTGRPRIYQHRMVLYDAIGPGPHGCHWCGTMLDWPDCQPDHLDRDRSNNDPGNLVPSCAHCNSKRGTAQANLNMGHRVREITVGDRTRHAMDWAADLGISATSLMWRIDNGWSPERAVSQPNRRHRKGQRL